MCDGFIVPNGFGLCVSLPLHKCSNLAQKFIGQIAQNPCYTLGLLFSRNLISSTNKKNKK